MRDIDVALVRPISQLLSGAATISTLAMNAEPDSKAATSDAVIFAALQEAQAQNRALREQALSAQSIEEIEAITPITSDNALTKTLQALE